MFIDELKKTVKILERKQEKKIPKEPTKLTASQIKWYKSKMKEAAEKGEKSCNIVYINKYDLTCDEDILDKLYHPNNSPYGGWYSQGTDKVYKYLKGNCKLVVDWLVVEGIKVTVYPEQLEDDYGSLCNWYNYHICANWN